MNTTRVSRLQLIEIVQENRVQHQKDYLRAMTGWRCDLKLVLENALNSLAAGTDPNVQVPTMPRSYDKDYDTALRKLDLSVDDVIELADHEFEQLVNDQWQGKLAFLAASAKYLGN